MVRAEVSSAGEVGDKRLEFAQILDLYGSERTLSRRPVDPVS
jgi:hypothetical protein